MSVPFFGEVILRNGVQPDPQKISALMEMSSPITKEEIQVFLGTINYLDKFSLSTVAACKPLCKSWQQAGQMWTWDASYQAIYDKAKLLINTNAYMKFYGKNKPLYLETDASRVGLGATLLTDER